MNSQKQEQAFLRRMDDLENRLSRKADEVVSYQLQYHRQEIDELVNRVSELESKIDQLKTIT